MQYNYDHSWAKEQEKLFGPAARMANTAQIATNRHTDLSDRIGRYTDARMRTHALNDIRTTQPKKEHPMLTRIAQTSLGLVLAFGLTPAAFAEDLAAPQGDAVLIVSGDISSTNTGETLVFDRQMLAALPTTTIETSTIWTEGVHSFTGVSLADLAHVVGMENGRFLATAINDYTIEIPFEDAVEGGPIIAYLMDDAEMSVRDKGPLWVIYPYDSDADYRTEVIYSRSIWQLDRVEIVQ